MDVVIRSVFKHWTDTEPVVNPSASTLAISIPRSHVRGQATLSAVDTTGGGRAWTRVGDMHGSFWTGSAGFGQGTAFTATTDRIGLQVFTDGAVTAAAVGTFFLLPPIEWRAPYRPTDFAQPAGLVGVAEESSWIAYSADGVVRGLHSYVRYEGADAIDDDQLRRAFVGYSDEPLELLPVNAALVSGALRLRVDVDSRTLSAE